jgi:hypothetical protein
VLCCAPMLSAVHSSAPHYHTVLCRSFAAPPSLSRISELCRITPRYYDARPLLVVLSAPFRHTLRIGEAYPRLLGTVATGRLAFSGLAAQFDRSVTRRWCFAVHPRCALYSHTVL